MHIFCNAPGHEAYYAIKIHSSIYYERVEGICEQVVKYFLILFLILLMFHMVENQP